MPAFARSVLELVLESASSCVELAESSADSVMVSQPAFSNMFNILEHIGVRRLRLADHNGWAVG